MRGIPFGVATALCVVACGATAPHVAPSIPVEPMIGVERVKPSPRATAAAGAPVGAPADASDWLFPCAQGTAEHTAAGDALGALSGRIDALAPSADPAPLFAEIASIAETPCFAVGEFSLSIPAPDTGLALKTYWNEGGRLALASRLGWSAPSDRTYFRAPSMRATLTKESAPKHPLAPLLCSATAATSAGAVSPVSSLASTTAGGAGACGSETEGWMLRARRFYHQHALADRGEQSSPGAAESFSSSSCADEAKRKTDGHAFDAFGECVELARDSHDALPLGKFRAPKDGWLVLRGRRGHHAWCSEIRAYDLATGAAYVAATCGQMFGSHRSVQRFEKGRLPVDALREAALMIFLANTAQRDVVAGGIGHPIPPEIEIKRSKLHGYSVGGMKLGSSSGRSTLVYQWVRAGRSIATGTLSWPDATYAADEQATELLAVAEAAMVQGCAPAPLPALPHAARADEGARVPAAKSYFPAYDEPEYAQLEKDLAALGQPGSKCGP